MTDISRPDRGPPRWEFLLSHHLPNRWDRTFGLNLRGRVVHFCARCTGQVAGVIAVAILFLANSEGWIRLFDTAVQLLFAVAPLPAAIDWLTQSIGKRESTNLLRLFSGLLLGMAFTDTLVLLLTGRWLFFFGAVAAAALYVGAMAAALKATGGWRMVLEEHFPGIELEPRP